MDNTLALTSILIFVVYIVIISVSLYYSLRSIRKMQDIHKNTYPVKHRLDENGYLQYSVDGKLWTHIIGYTDKMNYGKYVGPGFTYIKFEPNEKDAYNHWCTMLNSIQECHKWNEAAFGHYKEAIKNYINKDS